jgi:hypothetical protein
MTNLNNGAIATDLDAYSDSAHLMALGYTMCHIETWHEHDTTCVIWDAPKISELGLPF